MSASFQSTRIISERYQNVRTSTGEDVKTAKNLHWLRQFDSERALREGEEALKKFPDSLAVLYAVGRSYLHGERISDAARCFEKMKHIAPESIEAAIGLSRLYLQAGREEESLQILQDLVRHAPEDFSIKNNLGSAHLRIAFRYFEEGRKDKFYEYLALSAEWYDQVLKYAAHHGNALAGKADIALSQGKVHEAWAHFSHASQWDSGNISVVIRLVQTDILLSGLNDARKRLQRMEEQGALRSDIQLYHAHLDLLKGSFADAYSKATTVVAAQAERSIVGGLVIIGELALAGYKPARTTFPIFSDAALQSPTIKQSQQTILKSYCDDLAAIEAGGTEPARPRISARSVSHWGRAVRIGFAVGLQNA